MKRFVFSIIILPSLLAVFATGCSKENGDAKTADHANIAKATTSENGNVQNMAAGSINGRVIFKGKAPQPQRLMIVKDRDVCGSHPLYDERLKVSKDNGIQNAVVYLTGISGGKPLSSLGKEFILDQRGCRYQPHVLLLPVDTPLEVLNDDGILHNLHTFSKKNRPINMSQPKFRKKMEITFKHPEFVHARCDIHGWMSGWIVVVDQPYYAITDADGNFSLTDIPPGTYTLNCWQEKLGKQTTQVTVTAGSTVSSSFAYNEEGSQ